MPYFGAMVLPAARLIRALPALFLCALPLRAAVPAPVAPYFNGVFPNKAPGQTDWAVEDAFPNLSFTDPLWIAQVPGTEDMIVVEKAGRILRFPRNAEVAAEEVVTALDIRAAVQTSEDQGLYRLAFHPQFGDGGLHADEVFLCYNHRPAGDSPNSSMWRVSRFRWQAASGTIDPASEEVLIQIYDPHRWHNGGALAFDNDGFLLITCGDGGGANAEYNPTPSLTGSFFGGVLRIDVDMDPERSHPIRRQPTSAGKPFAFPPVLTQGYYIPNDNPWQSATGSVLEEFHALGLRSPHSAHYDAATGELWVGDVGQSKQEELDRVTKGLDYGWPYREGTLAGPRSGIPYGPEALPAYSYGRTQGGCIIAGMRYRGERWAAELEGKVLFGDLLKGNLSAYTPDSAEPPQELVPYIGNVFYSGFSNICTDAAGEIYLPKLNGQGQPGAKILILRKLAPVPEPPALLSQTGLFTDTAALVPAAPMMPYEVASPLWSDGAHKRRWIVLPSGTTSRSSSHRITWSATGNWGFPAGAVFVKHFEIPDDARDPGSVKRLETRVMVCTANGGKYGLTYRWNAAGTDAVLLAAGEDEIFTVTDENGASTQRTWSYPSRANCMECHTPASGQALGLRAHQIGMTVIPPGGDSVDQLAWFKAQQMFSSDASDQEIHATIQARAIDDESAPLEHRVRSYLDANCAHCHQPGATVSHFDARLQTPLKKQGLVNEAIKGQFHLPGGSYIKAGDPSLSAIHVRMAGTAPGVAMPPLGRHVVDEKAAGIIAGYIAGLNDGEFAEEPGLHARYLRLTAKTGYHTSIGIREFSALDRNHAAIPGSEVSIAAFSAETAADPAANATDGDLSTYWRSGTGAFPHFVTLDLGSVREIGGYDVRLPSSGSTEHLRTWEVHSSSDGIDWALLGSGSVSRYSHTFIRKELLTAKRPVRTSIAAPAHSAAAEFPVTIAFDTAVTDFSTGDLTVEGGTITAGSLRGSGSYYTVRVTATQPQVTLSMAADLVSTGDYGSRASNTIMVTSGLLQPVKPVFASSGYYFGTALEARIDFDQAYTGLTKDDFTLTNGKLEWLIQEGNSARLIISSSYLGNSSPTLVMKEGAVLGANGLWMGQGFSRTFSYRVPLLDSAHIYVEFQPGFSYQADAAAGVPGYYYEVPLGTRSGTTTPSSTHKLRFGFVSPHAGDIRVRAWTRADSAASDSFHVSAGGTVDAPVFPWQTNQGAGEIGSLQFHEGFARPAGGAPQVLQTGTGPGVLEIYAAEDGTKISRMEIVPVRPFPIWEELPMIPEGLRAKLRFTSPVQGLSPDDFDVLDGTITALEGSGRDYTVTFRPAGEQAYLAVKDGAVTDVEFGGTGIASLPYIAKLEDWTYEQWAAARTLSSGDYNLGVDTDRDGMGQFLEYALGLEPALADVKTVVPGDHTSHGLPKLELDDGPEGGKRLALIYHRRIGGTPMAYTVEFGDSPATLAPAEVTETVTPLNLQWEEVRATDASAPAGTKARFGRLRVEKLPVP